MGLSFVISTKTEEKRAALKSHLLSDELNGIESFPIDGKTIACGIGISISLGQVRSKNVGYSKLQKLIRLVEEHGCQIFDVYGGEWVSTDDDLSEYFEEP